MFRIRAPIMVIMVFKSDVEANAIEHALIPRSNGARSSKTRFKLTLLESKYASLNKK